MQVTAIVTVKEHADLADATKQVQDLSGKLEAKQPLVEFGILYVSIDSSKIPALSRLTNIESLEVEGKKYPMISQP